MIKIVVYDSGYGGELFADKLESELSVADIIRVIDWRNANQINQNAHLARKCAESALRPYIGNVDLIIFANHLLTLTSLKHFQRQYKNQKFLGINFDPGTISDSLLRPTLILTTTPVTRTPKYYKLIFKLKCPNITLRLDSWPKLIDDGELTKEIIKYDIHNLLARNNFKPANVILACTHFTDVKAEIKSALGGKVKTQDGFNETIRDIYKIIKIRGGLKKQKY
ncbi:hypothetical protein IJG04_00170 [Candidatus Saccharibacteria bacterium]|nr:hypothetical protein [Candidatus Saccharibacteria bacterium]